jgi:mycothiol synthase
VNEIPVMENPMNELPLSARVAPVSHVELPAATPGVEWRPATMDDVAGIHDCEQEMALTDHPHYVVPEEDLSDDFGHSYVDLGADTIVATDDTGRILAWGLVLLPPGQDTLVRSIFIGGVRPSERGRGLGRQLLKWQEQRGLQQLGASTKTLPGWLMAFTDERADATARLLRRFEFEVARYFLELRRDLSQPVPEVAIDDKLTIMPFSLDRSAATLAARNDAFRDHWGSQPVDEEQWDSFVAREAFRPELSFIAIDAADDVVGFVLASVNEGDWPGQGFSSSYIDLVGVTRAWRKRGIAPALLAATLRAISAARLDKAVLDVDSDSPTGALGLYTGLGFEESNRSASFNRIY